MDDSQFWRIVEAAEGDPDAVKEQLEKLSEEQVQEWRRIYWEKHKALHSWKTWNAGYLICGGMSDDSYHYFKAWLIGKGQKVYQTALENPDDLADHVSTDEADETGCDNELLNYAADEVMESLFGESDPDYETGEEGPPTGEPFDEDDPTIGFPKLTAKFWD